MAIRKEFVNEVISCEWLRNCGSKLALDFEVEYVSTEKEVKQLISSLKWENTCLEATNDLTVFLYKNHKDEYNKYWNTVVRQIKKEYIPILENTLAEQLNCECTKEVITDIKTNVIAILMHEFYREFYTSEFYERMLKIYLLGHLPCGWNGNYPDGKFIVY